MARFCLRLRAVLCDIVVDGQDLGFALHLVSEVNQKMKKKIKNLAIELFGSWYVRRQAKKRTVEHLVKQVLKGLDKMDPELASLNEEQALYKQNPKEWSIGEVVHHVTVAVKRLLEISEKLSQGEIIPNKLNRSEVGVSAYGIPLLTLKQDWEVVRADVATRLNHYTDAVGNTGTFDHPMLGPLDAHCWLFINGYHVHTHLKQIARIRASQGFPR